MDHHNPDDVADVAAALNEMFERLAREEEVTVDPLVALRNTARSRRKDGTEFFRDTEVGLGDRLASRFTDSLLLDETNPRAQVYWTVDPHGRWRADAVGDRTRMARAVLDEMRDRADELDDAGDPRGETLGKAAKSAETVGKIRAMLTLGCQSHGMMVNADEDFDQRNDVLACVDRLVQFTDLDVTMRPIEPADMITMSAAVSYDPEILMHPPAKIKEYHETFMPEADRQEAFYRIFGQMLYGGNKYRLFVIVKGVSTTGKSQLMEAIEAALGSYAATGPASVFRGKMDDGPRSDLLRVVKKRVVLFSEASDAWQLHGDRVKDLTGGGHIAARDMHSGKMVNRKPSFTPVLVTNEMPTIQGVDSGTKRRLLVISFNRTLPAGVTEDPDIKRAFVEDPEVQRWILARLVAGYRAAVQHGLDDAKALFGVETMEAFEGLTHTGEFLDWVRSTGQLGETDVSWVLENRKVSSCASLEVTYERYKHWVDNRSGRRGKFELLSYADFNEDLEKNHGWTKKKSGEWRWLGKMITPAPPIVSGYAPPNSSQISWT